MSFIGTVKDFVNIFKKDNKKEALDVLSQLGSLLSSLDWLSPYADQAETYPYNRVSLSKLSDIFRDETVGNACDFLTYVVMKRVGLDGYYHEDPEIQQLVNDSIQNMDGSFYTHCRDFLSKGIFFGYAASQLVFDVVEGSYLFGWMVNYNSEDISFMVAKNDRNKEFISKIKKGSNEFPAQNFLVYQYGDLANVYGFGRGNYLEKYYDLKLLCLKLWPIFNQKFTIPTIIGKAVNDIKDLMNRLKGWLYNNIIGIKSNEEVQLIERSAGTDASQIYEKCIEFCNKVIFRVFFMLSLLSGGETGGSYALGEKHFDLFMDAAEEIAMDFRDNVIISQIIVKLIEYNKGPQLDYGEFRPAQALSLEEKDKLSNIYYRLIQSGVIDPVEDDAWIRKDFEFPERQPMDITSLLTPDTSDNSESGNNENNIQQ